MEPGKIGHSLRQAPAMRPCWNCWRVVALDWPTTATSPPGPGFSPCDFNQDRRATSWVLPGSGDASFWPLRSAGDLMAYFVIRYAPPEVAPETILTAPREVR